MLLPTKKRTVVLVVCGALILAVIIFAIILITRPARSVEVFCTTYQQENSRLATSNCDTYSAKPFTNNSSSPRDFVTAFGNLERVAPDDIQPDVKTLKQVFETIDKDPAQALSASMSALGAESSVDGWTAWRCQ